MVSLFTSLKFTSKDVEHLGLTMVSVEIEDRHAIDDIKKWCRNCCSSWGFSEQVEYTGNFKHRFYLAFIDEGDLLALRIQSTADMKITNFWPSRMPFTFHLADH